MLRAPSPVKRDIIRNKRGSVGLDEGAVCACKFY